MYPKTKVELASRNLLGRRWECSCGHVHEVPLRSVTISRDAMLSLPSLLTQNGLTGRPLIVADPNTYEAAGQALVTTLKSAGCLYDLLILKPDQGTKLLATDEAAYHVAQGMGPEVTFLISVGAGTVNDLTKYAAYLRGLPYVSVATAASMNGYASPIAALAVKGMKRTLPAAPPILISADPAVIEAAPASLAQAGFGDLLAKPVSTADWMLESRLYGSHFCYEPFNLLSKGEKGYFSAPELIAQGDAGTIGSLLAGLVDSGVAMTIAGSTSPASGGEHLISHTLDMLAMSAGEPLHLHGAQVGVATLFSAALYEMLMAIPAGSLDPEGLGQRWKPLEAVEEEIALAFGALAAEVMSEYRLKWRDRDAHREILLRTAENWEELKKGIKTFLRPPAVLRNALALAGAPTNCGELGIESHKVLFALTHARYIRARPTVLDLAYDVGLLPERLDEALERSGILRG